MLDGKTLPLKWPNMRFDFYTARANWNRGVRTLPQFGATNLTFWSVYHANQAFCPEHVLKSRYDGKLQPTPVLCVPFLEHAAASFDVVLVNSGLHYDKPSLYESEVAPIFARLGAAARLRPHSRIIFSETSAQHFRGVDRSGLYERRTVVPSERQCYCQASSRDAFDWRNRITAQYRASHPEVRGFPFYELTRAAWHMHLAHTLRKANHSESTCDCSRGRLS